ncbi:UNVERIFIED_CONTAM: hypothetical protein HDU68_006585 [Siphonaria sp. JEL0065]|nr:hypothetical protein HDU68_006585 [Siphonaria sp. JEL0065]
MYIFNLATPDRDGALENDIIIHEIGHGLSNRLTGGPANSNCLSTTASGGLGEGWSDVLGYIMALPATFTRANDYSMGFWALNRPGGVRKYLYSTSLTTNKRMFSDLATLNEVHDIGEVWAESLYEVMWNMIDNAGFTPPADIGKSVDAGTGNTALLKILIAAMKIQPCNPSFLQARDAIITAEKSLYNGKFACDIWKGFAKRGAGSGATSSFTNNFALPAQCQDVQTSTTTSTTVAVPTSTVVRTSTTGGPVTSKTTTTTTTKVVPTTTAAGGGTSAGAPCTTYGAWACSNSLVCSYGGSGLVWIQVGGTSSC